MKGPAPHLPLRLPGLRCGVRWWASISCLLFLLAACCGSAQETSGAAGGRPVAATGLDLETLSEFERLDLDRDRSLSLSEFSTGELAQRAREVGDSSEDEVFRSIDIDGSGTVELSELLRSQLHRNVRLIDRAGSRNYMSLDPDHDGLISEEEYLRRDRADPAVFRRIDLNGSGKVGPVEWLHALARDPERKEILGRFAKGDTDDSGTLDPGEFEESGGEEAFAGLDANGNGMLSPGEFARTVSREEAEENLDDTERDLFRELDRNRDQVLSLREFGSHERFKAGRFAEAMQRRLFSLIDTNGDGELDAGEFTNRREAARGGNPEGKGRGAKGAPKGPPGRGGKAGR